MEIANGCSTLCPQLRAFGRCRLPACRERHVILGEVDKPQLPIRGEVEFQLIFARSANRLFARLLSHKEEGEGGGSTDYRQEFLALQAEMNDFFCRPVRKRKDKKRN